MVIKFCCLLHLLNFRQINLFEYKIFVNPRKGKTDTELRSKLTFGKFSSRIITTDCTLVAIISSKLNLEEHCQAKSDLYESFSVRVMQHSGVVFFSLVRLPKRVIPGSA